MFPADVGLDIQYNYQFFILIIKVFFLGFFFGMFYWFSKIYNHRIKDK